MGCRVAVPDMQSWRIACDASHRWIGALMRQPSNLYGFPGRVAVPMFFRGGMAARAKGTGGIAIRLIQMGVWRDPSQPEMKKRTRLAGTFGC
ncbi:hypothetical protein OKW35_005084 [Paraburkholderia sp. MM5477-R1]